MINRIVTFKYRAQLIMLLIVSLASSSCAASPSTVFQQSVCAPPCWSGIVPGHTSPAAGLDLLASAPEIDHSTLADHGEALSKGREAWRFNPGFAERYGRMYFDTERIYIVELWVYESLSLSRFVKELGEPQSISTISGWADTKWMSVTILYPEQGVALTSFDSWFWPDRPFVDIGPKLKIENVYYFEPGALLDLETLWKIFPPPDVETVQESLQEWSGYGEYTYTEWE